MLLLVSTLKIANSASFAKNLLWSLLFVFGIVVALCLSIIVFIVNANKCFITQYICYPLNISALYDNLQVLQHTRKGIFSIYAVISTWCWPKLPKHVADNSWMYSAPNVMLALAKKKIRTLLLWLAKLKYVWIFENYFVLLFIQKRPFCIGVPNSYFLFISTAAILNYLCVWFPSLASRRCHNRIETFTMTGSPPHF